MIKVAPSILSADFGNLIKDIRQVEEAGADLLHLDIMDGHFVPNLTFGPVVLKPLTGKIKLPLDVHLMVNNPEDFIKLFVPLGPLYITVHYEASRNLNDLIKVIKDEGIKAGISINPATPVESILNYLDKIDLILVMSVHPGFPGQKFMPEVLPKVKKLRQVIDEQKLKVDIQIDGGINGDNVKLVKEAGVDIIVAGSAIFGTSDYKAVITAFKK